jgi:hypothetical protein
VLGVGVDVGVGVGDCFLSESSSSLSVISSMFNILLLDCCIKGRRFEAKILILFAVYE